MAQSLAFALFLVAGVILATAVALKASRDFVRDFKQQREFGSLFFDIFYANIFDSWSDNFSYSASPRI